MESETCVICGRPTEYTIFYTVIVCEGVKQHRKVRVCADCFDESKRMEKFTAELHEKYRGYVHDRRAF